MCEYGVDFEVMEQELRARWDAEGTGYDDEGVSLQMNDDTYEFYRARCWEITELKDNCIVAGCLVKGKIDMEEALFTAVQLGYPSLIKRVLADGAKVDARVWNENKYGFGFCARANETPLLVAVRYGRVECLKLLIDAGSDITGDRGKEALAYATQYSKVACKNILRDAGAGRKVRLKK